MLVIEDAWAVILQTLHTATETERCMPSVGTVLVMDSLHTQHLGCMESSYFRNLNAAELILGLNSKLRAAVHTAILCSLWPRVADSTVLIAPEKQRGADHVRTGYVLYDPETGKTLARVRPLMTDDDECMESFSLWFHVKGGAESDCPINDVSALFRSLK